MKRKSNLYPQICSMANLVLADANAQKGKAKQHGVKRHNRNREANIQALHEKLINKTFLTSPYTTFEISEPKKRTIFRLPFYPDRIVQHAIVNVLEPVFMSVFTADTYSCIKGKGVHAAMRNLNKALKDEPGTQYCLKLDIRKFYPSINHAILKQLLRRKFKDANLLQLLDGIVDSAPGLPIGNYLSQFLANFYLSYFDHWIKEVVGVKNYFRYADDMVILADNKEYLHHILTLITQYLSEQLDLQVKGNHQIFPVSARGIDFLGYKKYHTHTLLRKSIKQNFCRMLKKRRNPASIAAYYGWSKHCNSRHLLKKHSLLNRKKQTR